MGNYDTIQIPVPGQPISSSLYGIRVRNAILDLDARVTQVETDTQAIIARGRRITSTGSLTATPVGVLRIDSVPIRAGHLYRISTSNLNFISSVANDIGIANIRVFYTLTPGGIATVANSTSIGGMRNVVDVTGSTNSNTVPSNAIYAPTADGYVSVLLGAYRAAGSGTMTMYGASGEPIDLTVEYAGPDPGDTGVIL